MPANTFDAREMSCTELQRVEPDGRGAGYAWWAQREGEVAPLVAHYQDELDRRGGQHIMGCAGIYPTARNADGSPQFAGEVCTYGTDDGSDAA